MAVTTPIAFLEVLERSGLVPEEELEALRESTDESTDPKAVARDLVKKGRLTKWQAGALLKGRHALRLGKYRLLEPLATGGLGDVFLGEHEQMQRRVALRILSRDITKDGDLLDHFLTDSQEVAKLDQRNIIHIYDIDREGDRYYVVMENAAGDNLRNLLDAKGKVSEQEAANYVRQAAEGLKHAHEHKILHLGLKPSCMTLDEQGVIKIRDFGMTPLAVAAKSDSDEHPISNPRYSSPEQRVDHECDVRSDIFSLGVIGFQLISGNLPSSKVELTNSRLEKIFRKMMAKKPENRLQTMDEVCKYLDGWIEKNGTSQPAKPPQRKLQKAVSLSDSNFGTLAPTDSLTDTGLEGLAELENSAAPAAADEFAIDIGGATEEPRQAGAPSLPAPSAGMVETLDSEEPDEPVADAVKKKVPIGVWIGIGGGAAALIIIGLVVALVIVANSKNPPPVAVAPNDVNNTTPKDGTSEPKDGTPDPAKDKANDKDEEKLPPLGAGNEDPLEKGDDPEQVAKVDPNDAGKGTNNDGKQPPADGSKASPPGKENDKDKKGTPDKGAPKANPQKGTNDKGPMKPDDKTKPMPVKPKPPVKPKTPPNPFAKIPVAVELPSLGNAKQPVENFTEAVSLGPVTVDKADILIADLMGGQNVYKGNQKFSMKNADGGLAERAWEVFVSPSSVANDGELIIAKLWISEDKLWFQWTEKAEAEVASNYLRNCVFAIRTGSAGKDIALRKPVGLEAMEVQLDKGGMQLSAPIDYLPDAAAVRIELGGFQGKFPPHRFDPQPEMEARATSKLVFGDPGQEVLYFKVASSLRGTSGVQLTLSPMLFPEARKVTAFRAKSFDDMVKGSQLQSQQMKAQIDQFGKLNANEQKKYRQQIDQLKQRHSLVQKQASALAKVQQYITEMAGGKIGVRVFVMTDEHELDLARSPGMGPQRKAVAANKKK